MPSRTLLITVLFLPSVLSWVVLIRDLVPAWSPWLPAFLDAALWLTVGCGHWGRWKEVKRLLEVKAASPSSCVSSQLLLATVPTWVTCLVNPIPQGG